MTTTVVEKGMSPPLSSSPSTPQEEEDSIPAIVESSSSISISSNDQEREAMKPMDIAPMTPSNLRQTSPTKTSDQYRPLDAYTSSKEDQDDYLDAPECWMDQQDTEQVYEQEPTPQPMALRLQRMARKAGIIIGGGTLTAVGTFLLFVPAPTPSIYMMIGGMAVLAKEFPAAQRQLDSSRESLFSALARAQQEDDDYAAAMKAREQHGAETQSSVGEDDEGAETELSEEESQQEEGEDKESVAAIPQKSAFKRHFENVGRKVILPLLTKVCTPQQQEGDSNTTTTTNTATPSKSQQQDGKSSPRGVASFDEEDTKENTPSMSPFAKFAQFRDNLRAERLKAEEKREREAMLKRINEANLKECQLESSKHSDEEEEEESALALTDTTIAIAIVEPMLKRINEANLKECQLESSKHSEEEEGETTLALTDATIAIATVEPISASA
jgi:hypothetical protein